MLVSARRLDWGGVWALGRVDGRGGGGRREQDRQERLIAKRRARKCVRLLYYAIKVVGVAACVFTSGLNLALVYMRPDFRREMDSA